MLAKQKTGKTENCSLTGKNYTKSWTISMTRFKQVGAHKRALDMTMLHKTRGEYMR